MLQKIKKWGIYALVGIVVCGTCFVFGYVVRWKQSPVITVDGGAIIEKTNIIYRPIPVNSSGGCNDIISKYNSVLYDYNFFLSAVPEVYSVTSENIYFKLATQRYRLSYKYTEKARWSITPYATARIAFAPGLAIYYGGGCSVEYFGITGMVAIDNQPALTIGAGYRIVIP